jgi:segregation and condensation protein A
LTVVATHANRYNTHVSYTITLPTFEGPLDLLLRLIERAELDITTIALARVADQYLAHVRSLQTIDPTGLAQFVALAARLLQIKSRALLPRDPDADRGAADTDPDAEELAEQLRAYQRYKEAAGWLRLAQEDDRRMFLRLAPVLPLVEAPPALEHSITDLLAAVERRLQLRLPLEAPDTLNLPPRRTIAQVAARIRERLVTQSWLSFEDLFDDVVSREDVIVVFWTVLEMLKRSLIVVDQDRLFDRISIGRGSGVTEPSNDTDDLESAFL